MVEAVSRFMDVQEEYALGSCLPPLLLSPLSLLFLFIPGFNTVIISSQNSEVLKELRDYLLTDEETKPEKLSVSSQLTSVDAQ